MSLQSFRSLKVNVRGFYTSGLILTLSYSMFRAVSCLENCSLLESSLTHSSLTDATSDRIKAFSSCSRLSCSSSLDKDLAMEDI
ncbi:hypothetical protein GDO78_021794 [Eleutherodactylus coqui]|uniref:Uncharacterized protein n=1 Tax=Eleutherodactylus coqui TaxID=57060 RepID=A0A8J6BI57_ELECQ|nr:hypothetical protein GDO78_021794 [Eleutherodactylus coqui]